MPKIAEVAKLVVGGRFFTDWSAVRVEHRVGQAQNVFMLTVSERSLPLVFEKLQFLPGDPVEIYLAGVLALTGFIHTRQVAYDAGTHMVRLIGESRTGDLAASTVESKTGNFDGYGFEQVARSCLAPFGMGLQVLGKETGTPFKWLQAQPGETVFAFLDRLARMRGLILAPGTDGRLVAISELPSGVVGALVEGKNILRAQANISDRHLNSPLQIRGQHGGSDEAWGDAVSKLSAFISNPNVKRYRPFSDNVEHPVTADELKQRLRFETRWRAQTEIEVEAVVQGWLNGAELWRIASQVNVHSPMMVLNQALAVRAAIFEQSTAAGTTTTLELVKPEALNGRPDLSAANQRVPGVGPQSLPIPDPRSE